MAENVNSSMDNIVVTDEAVEYPAADQLQQADQHRVRIVTTKPRTGPMRDILAGGKAITVNNKMGGEHPVFRISLPPNSQGIKQATPGGSGTVRIVKISRLGDRSQAARMGRGMDEDEEDDFIDSNELVEDVKSPYYRRSYGGGGLYGSPRKMGGKDPGRKKDDVMIILDGQPSSLQKRKGPGRKPKGMGDERQLAEPLPPPRSYVARKPANKEDLGEYIKWRERRDRNNDAVRRTRVKKKQRELEMEIRLDHLTRTKEKVLSQLRDAYKEMKEMREILKDIKEGKEVAIPQRLTEEIPESVIEELLFHPEPEIMPTVMANPMPGSGLEDEVDDEVTEGEGEGEVAMGMQVEGESFTDQGIEQEAPEEEESPRPKRGRRARGPKKEAEPEVEEEPEHTTIVQESPSGRPVRSNRGKNPRMEL